MMKGLRPRLTPRAAARLLASSALVLFLSLAAFAQPPPPSDPAAQDAFNKRDMRDRESALRIKAKTVRRPIVENPELALSQIKEDYERVQVVNNDLRRAAAAGAPDYKRVAALAAEMKKRAARLKENLAFPEPAEERAEPKAADAATGDGARVKDSLAALDRLVVSFVTNPLFQSVEQQVDAALAERAARDLERIIKLSADLKKTAERLHKSHDKPGGL